MITSKVRVRDTHEHRISTHTIVTAELYAIPKREVFFLFPRFCIFIYLFILVFLFFFLFGNSQNSIIVTLLLVMFYSRKTSAITYSGLTFNPYSSDIFVISTYFITTSYSISQFMFTSSAISSYRYPATTEYIFSHILYFQASLLNDFINILLISVPQNLNIT